MCDYMMALQDRFQITSQRTIKQENEVRAAHDALHTELDRHQQRLLLRFVDAVNRLCEEKRLDGFISGFRLADGIRAELNEIPAYSFEQESEKLAHEEFEGRSC